MTTPARKRIFLIEKLITNGFEPEFILDVYFKEVRSILEYGAVLFHHALTRDLSEKIEAIQRLVLRLLSSSLNLNLSYMESSILWCVEPLSLRRDRLCVTFLKRTLKNENHTNILMRRSIRIPSKRPYQEDKSYHFRHFSSPMVALRRLANKIL